jgi:hypothetical protein
MLGYSRGSVLPVPQAELARLRVEGQLQFAPVQHVAVMVAEHGHQHLAAEGGLDRSPVDVEMIRKLGSLAVFEHVQPPGVVGVHHAHVVRHRVQYVAHAVLGEGGAEALQILIAADLGIDRVVVDDVVAVRAAGAGLEVGRAVDVGDAQFRQVGHDGLGVLEGERLVELQAVGGQRGLHRLHGDGGGRGGRFRGDATFLDQGLADAEDAGVLRPFLDVQRKLAPPVRVLVDGAGQVGLFQLAEHVLGLDQRDLCRRAGQVAEDGADQGGGHFGDVDRMHADALGQQALPFEGQHDAGTVVGAADDLAGAHLLAGIEVEVGADVEVDAFPEAGKRRQVMRGGGHQGLLVELAGLLEAAVLAALEIEQAVGEHAHFREGAADLVRNRAQVFPDHQALVALAFQGQDAEQVVERIADIGAVLTGEARRHPVQPHHAHDMVDAQRPRVFHVGAQHGDEGGVGRVAQPLRHPGRQAPVLAVRIEVVGRAADPGIERIELPVHPGLRAASVHPDGEIEVKADAEVHFQRTLPDGAELLVGQPLQP